MVSVDGGWVEFRFYRPQANQVFLAGDFNEWRAGELSMVRRGDGYWHAHMHLPAGEYRFRYCADGAWYADYAAFGLEPGRFGLDSVLRVPAARLKVTVSAPADVPPAADSPSPAPAAA